MNHYHHGPLSTAAVRTGSWESLTPARYGRLRCTAGPARPTQRICQKANCFLTHAPFIRSLEDLSPKGDPS